MTPWQYKAIVVRVVDGDTVDVDIDLGFNIWKKNARIRLKGVDTPEKRTRDLLEKQFGNLATGIVEEFCPQGSEILLETDLSDKEKFGRILGNILVANPDSPDPTLDYSIDLNGYLISNHYAVA
ncbi:MAG: hypothetical protein DRQ47_04535, partial [Gammaproteobacteria bacterium]